MVCDSRGDSNGVNEVILAELAEEFVRKDIDVLLFPGDLITGMFNHDNDTFESQLRNWTDIMAPVYDAGISVYLGRGNHEVGDSWYRPPADPCDTYAHRWLNVFGSAAPAPIRLPDNGPAGEEYMTYSVTHENTLFVMLDQYAGMEHKLDHRVNQTWLDAQLAANTKPHIFVAIHEPAFKAKNRAGFDSYPNDRDRFWASLTDSGARVSFAGHDHFFNHARIDDGDGDPNNDVHQYIVGTAGPMYVWNGIYPGPNGDYTPVSLHHCERHGYVIGEVNDLDVSLTWYQRSTPLPDANGVYEPNETWTYSVAVKPFLLSPNGGEDIAAESTYKITWKTVEGDPIYSVRLSYSLDGGANWDPIALTANTGSYRWTVPTADSNQCLVRIEDARNPQLGDSSDLAFTIYPCPKDLLFDLDNDCYLDFLDFGFLAVVPNVNFDDLAGLMSRWLECANPFDPICTHPE